MYAFTLILLDRSEAPGVLFNDGRVYVHEPICQSYGSRDEMLEDVSGSTLQLIGPFMATELAKARLDEDHKRTMKQIEKTKKQIEKEYRSALQWLECHVKDCEAE